MPKYRRNTVFRNIGETCPNVGGIHCIGRKRNV